MANRQEAPYRICECGRGKIYTAEQDRVRNVTVDGNIVCYECFIDKIYRRVTNGRVEGESP